MIADSSNAAATAAGATLSANLGIPTGKQEPVLVSQAFGEMVYVLTQSPVHRHMFVADLEWLLLPPILAGNIRIFRDKDGKGPAAFAIWALVSDEVHERLKSANLAAGPLRLQPNEWLSGTNIWLMELCSPKGYTLELLTEMKQQVFKDNPVHMHVSGEWKTI